MSGGAAWRFALSLLPDLVEWIVGRFEAGESPDVIRRDIKDRRAEVDANRAKRDEEFEAKFGRPLGSDAQHQAELDRLCRLRADEPTTQQRVVPERGPLDEGD